ncbi:tyrosine-type recombinase/integrase [Microbulbifer sp. JSM ZJ756]|uniref:tyrosine-type recombinase/integrase n=1 Tax=Microbulbifer sp. JSM ZJ756 TaxID=3376191 RepID=UPI0037A30DAD
MPAIHKLTALKVKSATKTVGDGGGLWLKIQSGGQRSWTFRYRFAGRAREIGIGSATSLTLAEAREIAAEFRALVAKGTDPKVKRDAERVAQALERNRARTFDQCVDSYLAARSSEWRNAKHRQQWRNTLHTYASPLLGHLPAADIGITEVVKVLEPIWRSKTETATRVRQRIEAVLDWATVMQIRHGDNPARWKGNLSEVLPTPTKVKKVKHHGAMPVKDMPRFMARLRDLNSVAAMAMEFTILTAARTGEVIGATWDEIDLASRTWTVPPERMKAGKQHVVPLPDRAVELLTLLPRFEETPYLFPGARTGRPISNMTMLKLLKQTLGYPDYTVHGFRSTFRDWAAEETSFPVRAVEYALAHQLKDKVEAAYQRSNLLEQRRELMHAWMNFLATERPSKHTDSVTAAVAS